LYFAEGEGPRFERPLREEWEDTRLERADPNSSLRMSWTRCSADPTALNNAVPLIGFAGSPFTLACYMIEGGGSQDFHGEAHALQPA
jgi:uroporphyrinogen decarboxylase